MAALGTLHQDISTQFFSLIFLPYATLTSSHPGAALAHRTTIRQERPEKHPDKICQDILSGCSAAPLSVRAAHVPLETICSLISPDIFALHTRHPAI